MGSGNESKSRRKQDILGEKWTKDSSYKTFESYLRFVFAYAGTLSMVQESKKISEKDIRPGDIFIYGGSPGHVEMVVDVCENKSGDKAFCLDKGICLHSSFIFLKPG